MSEDEEIVRPVVVCIASVILFLLGFVLTISAIIVIAVTYLPLQSIHVTVIVISLAIGPLLILTGYNLWKMKKWAAQLAAIIVLFDLISIPFIHLLIPLDIGDILALIGDIIILILISQSLKILTKKE